MKISKNPPHIWKQASLTCRRREHHLQSARPSIPQKHLGEMHTHWEDLKNSPKKRVKSNKTEIRSQRSIIRLVFQSMICSKVDSSAVNKAGRIFGARLGHLIFGCLINVFRAGNPSNCDESKYISLVWSRFVPTHWSPKGHYQQIAGDSIMIAPVH